MAVGDMSRFGENTTVPMNRGELGNTEGGEQLLPGIPDEITIFHISPKLPWTAFHALSSVSHGWQRAIQSHQIYDARVRSKSTQTLVALRDTYKDVSTIALFSMEDGSCYHLPPIPYFGRIPRSCACIFLDGKLYVLGGLKDWIVGEWGFSGANVFVFDMAGKRQWQQCASMKDPRTQFGCGIKDGKIYAFGGSSNLEPVCGSEVYDPGEDAWAPITSMPSFAFRNKVTTVGDELFVHGGDIYYSNFFRRADQGLSSVFHYMGLASSAEVYHPLTDKWRVLEKFNRRRWEVVLMVGEKLHRLSVEGIEVYDIDAGTWNHSKPLVFDVLLPRDSFIVEPIAAVAVGDEVLAMVCWETIGRRGRSTYETCLIRSQGVRGGSEKTVWQKLQCSLSLGHECIMCSIQL